MKCWIVNYSLTACRVLCLFEVRFSLFALFFLFGFILTMSDALERNRNVGLVDGVYLSLDQVYCYASRRENWKTRTDNDLPSSFFLFLIHKSPEINLFEQLSYLCECARHQSARICLPLFGLPIIFTRPWFFLLNRIRSMHVQSRPLIQRNGMSLCLCERVYFDHEKWIEIVLCDDNSLPSVYVFL